MYIPLGGNRKGKIRTQLNNLVVFVVSGLWHGASWTFVFWGTLHGLYQIIENVSTSKMNLPKSKYIRVLKVILTFILVDFAWIFFRANTIQDAFLITKNLFNFGLPFKYSLLNTSLLELIILAMSIIIVYVLEIIGEKHDLENIFYSNNILIRWAIYYIVLIAIIIFGIYGPGFDIQEFIYFQF